MAQRSRTQLLTSQHEDDGDEITYVPARKGTTEAHRNLKPNCLGCLTEPGCDATLVAKGAWQQVARIEDLFLSHICGFPSYKRVRAVSQHHTTLSSTCRKDGVIEPTRVKADVGCVEHFLTSSLRTEKSAALLEPLETHTFTQSPED